MDITVWGAVMSGSGNLCRLWAHRGWFHNLTTTVGPEAPEPFDPEFGCRTGGVAGQDGRENLVERFTSDNNSLWVFPNAI
jgi:hypothetical protein